MVSRIKKPDSYQGLTRKQLQKKVDDLIVASEISNQLDSQVNLLSQELIETKKSLKNAQLKYRGVTGQNSDLKLERDKFKKELEEAVKLQDRLIKEISKNSLIELESKSNQVKASNLAGDIFSLKKIVIEKDIELEKIRSDLSEARANVVKVKNTLSFRFGYILIFAFKSWRNFFSLPKDLYALKAESKSKRNEKRVKIKRVTEQKKAIENSSKEKTVVLKDDQNFTLSDKLKGLKVASVMDEFTFNSFLPECNLFGLTPQNWKAELESFKPDVVFIESAWRGKLDLWGAKVGHMSQEIIQIAQWCKDNNVASLFWNKEDPVHYETFLNSARLFDHIFTTDLDCVSRYKSALQHENVYFLPFAAQPKNNNPIEKYQRKDAFCFAGAYYKKYPERTKDLGNFLVSFPSFKPLEIYDRNYGKENPEYMFPSEYSPYIVGTLPFEEIDKAYKGYNFAINLNSIKQSQSMFARRVFELLASNTITVSNFSKGLRNLFGDLVFTSDSGEKIVSDLNRLVQSGLDLKKFKLLALRKVLSEHTYQDRLAYIYSKLSNAKLESLLPVVHVFSYVKTMEEFESLYEQYDRQGYSNKKLQVLIPAGLEEEFKSTDTNVQFLPVSSKSQARAEIPETDWVATFTLNDFYDEYYLTDLILATRYTEEKVIGKASYYKNKDGVISLKSEGESYKLSKDLPARCSIAKANLFASVSLSEVVQTLYTRHYLCEGFSIDEFSYCMNGESNAASKGITTLEKDIDLGSSFKALSKIAESTKLVKSEASSLQVIEAKELMLMIPKPAQTNVEASDVSNGVKFTSGLSDGKHEYWYANKIVQPEGLGAKNGKLNLFLETEVGLNIQFVLFFLDKNGQRLSHVVKASNKNNLIDIPVGTKNIKFGLRIYAGGEATIKKLYLEHKPSTPVDIVQNSDVLLITNNYPSYEDLYKNGFVHSRAKAYKDHGYVVDVWRFKPEHEVSFHEFQGIDVTTGGAEYLAHSLSINSYKHVLVHFLDENIWNVLKEHIHNTRVTVWVHGADIQSYERRAFLYETEEQLQSAKTISDKKQDFWRSVLNQKYKNLHMVFVSNYLASTAMEDLGVDLDKSQYSIIPNPIDTDLFSYKEKPVEQRKKILSIRPYASKVYANDLAVKAVLELSKEDFFQELEFRFVGDGPLFDEVLEPLRKFNNVIIERRFLNQIEISELHKEYGVFLCPSRMDTQGVSRDEAMASGLVPVTNSVAAIPEFVDGSCGFIVPGEDYVMLSKSIISLVESSKKFLEVSHNSRSRVNMKSSLPIVIDKELNLFR